MSLRLKINLIVAGVIALLVATMIALQIDGLRRAVREEVQAANRVTAQLLHRMGWVYTMDGPDSLVRFLQRLGRVRANEITLTDAQGQVLYRSPPSTYKEGREAPEWFSALILPQASSQVIELPNGRLTIDAEPSRAVLDGWDDLLVLAAGGAATLLVINALVFWAMGRALRPFSQIVDGLNRLQAGDFEVVLPPLRGQEAGAIGASRGIMPCMWSYRRPASSVMTRAAWAVCTSACTQLRATDMARLRIAVTDWPSSSCRARAISRRSASMCPSIRPASSRESDSRRSAS